MHTPTPSAFLLQPDGIGPLMPQARLLLELRRRLAGMLPDSLKSTCSIANYKQGRIVIYAANGAVAAKLKLLHSELANRLSERVQVTGIEIQVQPPELQAQVLVAPREIGDEATGALTRLMEQLPDSELKNVIARLVRRQDADSRSK